MATIAIELKLFRHMFIAGGHVDIRLKPRNVN